MQIIHTKLLLLILSAVLSLGAFLMAHEQKQKAEDAEALQQHNRSMQSVQDTSRRSNGAQTEKYHAPKLP